eukprot:3948032-Prymnesium_polylepis.1
MKHMVLTGGADYTFRYVDDVRRPDVRQTACVQLHPSAIQTRPRLLLPHCHRDSIHHATEKCIMYKVRNESSSTCLSVCVDSLQCEATCNSSV